MYVKSNCKLAILESSKIIQCRYKQLYSRDTEETEVIRKIIESNIFLQFSGKQYEAFYDGSKVKDFEDTDQPLAEINKGIYNELGFSYSRRVKIA